MKRKANRHQLFYLGIRVLQPCQSPLNEWYICYYNLSSWTPIDRHHPFKTKEEAYDAIHQMCKTPVYIDDAKIRAIP